MPLQNETVPLFDHQPKKWVLTVAPLQNVNLGQRVTSMGAMVGELDFRIRQKKASHSK